MPAFLPFLAALFAVASSARAAGGRYMELGTVKQGPVEAVLSSLSTKGTDALVELRELYRRYADVVASKRELDGWEYALETGTIVEHPDERILPARQAEDAYRRRSAELRRLEEAYDATTNKFQDAAREELRYQADKKKREVRAARRFARRTKGLSLDWSDLVWAELTKLDPEHWSVSDAVRDASPRHSAAVVCTPAEDPTLCLAFDPWPRGEPDVYEYETWNKASTSGRLPPEYFLHHLPERRRKS